MLTKNNYVIGRLWTVMMLTSLVLLSSFELTGGLPVSRDLSSSNNNETSERHGSLRVSLREIFSRQRFETLHPVNLDSISGSKFERRRRSIRQKSATHSPSKTPEEDQQEPGNSYWNRSGWGGAYGR